MEILQEAKYPAKRHCRKVADYLSSALDNTVPTTFYLQGQITRLIEDNDEPQPFRYDNTQRPFFLFVCFDSFCFVVNGVTFTIFPGALCLIAI